MNEIYILFLILGVLFIIENKSINLLAYYVGMVILIAILISIYPDLNNIQQFWNGISYISYMLVLVQISALTILFGFIIMLYPKNNTDILIKQKNNNKILINNNNNSLIIICILIIFISIIYYIFNNNENQLINILNSKWGWEISEINNIHPNIWVENNTSIFINKISYLLYCDPSNILKLVILTIILLFAIICLFFILNPTI